MNINGEKSIEDNPCIGICSTTYGDDICRGCGRTVDQIRDWNTYSKEEKIKINLRNKGKDNATSKY